MPLYLYLCITKSKWILWFWTVVCVRILLNCDLCCNVVWTEISVGMLLYLDHHLCRNVLWTEFCIGMLFGLWSLLECYCIWTIICIRMLFGLRFVSECFLNSDLCRTVTVFNPDRFQIVIWAVGSFCRNVIWASIFVRMLQYSDHGL